MAPGTLCEDAPRADPFVLCCAGMEPVRPRHKHRASDDVNTCLGDLYSVAWIELAEATVLRGMPLQLEFELVRNRTSNNFTYTHVRCSSCPCRCTTLWRTCSSVPAACQRIGAPPA